MMRSEVNVWSLEKAMDIKEVLILLQTDYEQNQFIIENETPTDNCAIYLRHRELPRFRAYLFTIGQSKERYGVHLEFPKAESQTNLMESYENLTYKTLSEILAVHLDLV